MTPQNRNEFLSLVLLATMIGVVLGRVATALSAPFSTPMNFVLRDDERRDGPSSLDAGRTPGEVILRLAFAGDIMQHRQQAHDDFGASYEQLAPMLAAADIAAGNLEFPVDTTRPVGPPPSSVQFNGSPGHVAALAAAGFDVLSTANNHCFDQGLAGLVRTHQVQVSPLDQTRLTRLWVFHRFSETQVPASDFHLGHRRHCRRGWNPFQHRPTRREWGGGGIFNESASNLETFPKVNRPFDSKLTIGRFVPKRTLRPAGTLRKPNKLSRGAPA